MISYGFLWFPLENHHGNPRQPRAPWPQNYFFGLAEGFCVMTGGCAVGSITGGMMNPAVAARDAQGRGFLWFSYGFPMGFLWV